MKKMDLAKCVIVLVITFIANLSTYAAKMNNNLIYNAEEVNGMKVAETVYKKDGNMLTNYMKYNYPLYLRQQECNYRILQMEFQEE